MGPTNEAVVRRSHASQPQLHDPQFTYDEAIMTRTGFKAASISSGLGLFMTGLALPPTRYLLEKAFLLEPGTDPDAQERADGFHQSWLYGETTDGQYIKVKVSGDGDPAYLSTSRMPGQAVLNLALDQADSDQRKTSDGGFWTPASLLGKTYLKRLTNYAALRFEVVD